MNYVFSKIRLFVYPDSIPLQYALYYINDSYSGKRRDEKIIEIAKTYIELGKTKILDLGALPGLYCKRFFELGALVTWHDISKSN